MASPIPNCLALNSRNPSSIKWVSSKTASQHLPGIRHPWPNGRQRPPPGAVWLLPGKAGAADYPWHIKPAPPASSGKRNRYSQFTRCPNSSYDGNCHRKHSTHYSRNHTTDDNGSFCTYHNRNYSTRYNSSPKKTRCLYPGKPFRIFLLGQQISHVCILMHHWAA